ncbi:MAG: cytochrome c oxidase accessory protein CcoG [Phycisphaerae bacterium]
MSTRESSTIESARVACGAAPAGAAARSLPLLQPEDQVLATLNADGTRRWLKPRVSRGRFLTARRWTAYGLIALFTVLPHIPINGKPAMFLDVAHRQFTVFGATFLPTDTKLLALLMLSAFVAIFLLTALLGRVWCGWACPQTVYLEFLYRPLERWLEGTAGRGGRPVRSPSAGSRVVMYGAYLLISMFLAHTFLAYFVGVDALAEWVRRSPLEHPASFAVMAVTTALMMFNFCYFREQTCLVACPYGRFQSVLLDRDSMIISYDTRRGEPRRKLSAAGRAGDRGARAGADAPTADSSAAAPDGDCIDCHLCVATCPTGIDIRKGLQLECVGCAQCIDACNAVMEKIDRPRGLIRYTSEARVAGEQGRVVRGRVLFYALGLLVAGTLLTYFLSTRASADVAVLRGQGLPFNVLPSGEVASAVRIKITNRGERAAAYTVRLAGASPAVLATETPLPVTLKPGESQTVNAIITAPRGMFDDGHASVVLHITDGESFKTSVKHGLLGPADDDDDHDHDEQH